MVVSDWTGNVQFSSFYTLLFSSRLKKKTFFVATFNGLLAFFTGKKVPSVLVSCKPFPVFLWLHDDACKLLNILKAFVCVRQAVTRFKSAICLGCAKA